MTAAPEGRGDDVARAAFTVGIEKVLRRQVETHHRSSRLRKIIGWWKRIWHTAARLITGTAIRFSKQQIESG